MNCALKLHSMRVQRIVHYRRLSTSESLHRRTLPTMSKVYSETFRGHSSTFNIHLHSMGTLMAISSTSYNRHADRDFLRGKRGAFFYRRFYVLSRVAGKTTPMPQVLRRAAVAGFAFRRSLRAPIRIYRRIVETKGAGRTEPYAPSFPLSFSSSLFLSLCLYRSLPPFSLLLPLFLRTRSPSILGLYDSRGESMRVCMHSLRSGMTGERIQFPSSLSCLHLQLGPRSDHPC